jgi:hypothetical protein
MLMFAMTAFGSLQILDVLGQHDMTSPWVERT